MPPLPVIVRLDIFEDIGFCLFPRRVAGSVNLLDLQRVEKAFHYGVVIAVSFAAHTAQETMAFQQALLVIGGVLAASIGMDN